MSDRWRLDCSLGALEIERTTGALRGDAALAAEIRTSFARWWAGPATRAALVEMHAAITDRVSTARLLGRAYDGAAAMAARLADAAETGRLRARIAPDQIPLASMIAGKARDDEAGANDGAPPKDTTWIEIAMVDQDGAPVPRLAYRIELPNGAVREGRLNSHGIARLDGIDPGACKVSFPEVDGREWSA